MNAAMERKGGWESGGSRLGPSYRHGHQIEIWLPGQEWGGGGEGGRGSKLQILSTAFHWQNQKQRPNF